jgi:CubicO group peptidase (beta-lactamase class C family)
MSRSVVKGHSRLCRAIARAVLCAFLQVIAVQGAPPGQKVRNTQAAPSIPELEKKIPELMATAMIPGLSIALISNGQVAWHKGYGVSNASTKAPVTDDTVFEAASLSKPVFAYAVLKLVDQGRLDLDKPLSEYLPEPYIAGDDRLKLITARIVLQHTTGFPNWRSAGKPLAIHFRPGEKFSYSGEGYVYLQKAVEHITGKPANDLLWELVFVPLGMRASSYIWCKEYDAQSATGHGLDGSPVLKIKPGKANAAASLHTTALDYARFIVAAMDGLGLEQGSADQMLSMQVKVDEDCTNCLTDKSPHLSENLGWGLGWGLEKLDRGTFFWHWGDNGAFRCFAIASRQSRSGMVMFTNSIHGLSILNEMVQLTIGGMHPATSWVRYDQYNSPARRILFTVLKEGADAGIRQYRAAAEKEPGTPVPPENSINSLGYDLLRLKKVEDAIRIFQWNTELYPKSWNVYDSLAEAYATQGKKELAIQYYRKSIELNPDNANGRNKLKELESGK